MVVRLVRDQEAAGSSPVTPTNRKEKAFLLSLFRFCGTLVRLRRSVRTKRTLNLGVPEKRRFLGEKAKPSVNACFLRKAKKEAKSERFAAVRDQSAARFKSSHSDQSKRESVFAFSFRFCGTLVRLRRSVRTKRTFY